MESPPLVLVIDDSQTARKMVESYLSQAGYRVVTAADAERGLQLAASARPALILLDHQLPGTTGDKVCRRLLDSEATASVPVVICSALRNRAFVQYADFPNVVDQIPKPFTPELLRSGVANALKVGSMVVRAQATGSALPESLAEDFEAALAGTTAVFPFRALMDFLNNGRYHGRLTVETGKDRLQFALASGRIQAAYSSTLATERIAAILPPDLADLAPLLSITLAEHHDPQMAALIKLLERSLSDPRRVRAFLRCQSAVLAYWALTGEPGSFTFESGGTLPPMFQAFPLHLSLPALAVEGVRRCEPAVETSGWEGQTFSPANRVAANPDRAGLSTAAQKVFAALDGVRALESVASEVGLGLADATILARGLELAGLVERRSDVTTILVVEADPESQRIIKAALDDDDRFQVKAVGDRVGAQLLFRRVRFDLVLMTLDRPEQEQFYATARAQAPASTRFVALVDPQQESDLMRLETIGLDGVLERPLTEAAVASTVRLLIEVNAMARVS